jgi:hypothetical protein
VVAAPRQGQRKLLEKTPLGEGAPRRAPTIHGFCLKISIEMKPFLCQILGSSVLEVGPRRLQGTVEVTAFAVPGRAPRPSLVPTRLCQCTVCVKAISTEYSTRQPACSLTYPRNVEPSLEMLHMHCQCGTSDMATTTLWDIFWLWEGDTEPLSWLLRSNTAFAYGMQSLSRLAGLNSRGSANHHRLLRHGDLLPVRVLERKMTAGQDEVLSPRSP